MIDLPDRRVRILIGTDTPEAHWVLEQRHGGRNEPFAILTKLGWAVLGPTGSVAHACRQMCHVRASANDITDRLNDVYNAEYADTDVNTTAPSAEDVEARQIVEASTKLVDVHNQIAVPWRRPLESIRSSHAVALERQLGLRKRFLKDGDSYKKCAQCIFRDLEKGYAEIVPNPKEPDKFCLLE